MSQDTLNVNMGALAASRQWGSASIGDAKHGVDVKVELDNVPSGVTEPAYIARGGCTPPSHVRWRNLRPVIRGKSKSYVRGLDIGLIKKGRYSIVVVGAGGHPVSCGNFQT
jgi:hypothetical protein